MVRTRGRSRVLPRVRFSTPEQEAAASVPVPVPEPVPEPSPVPEAVPDEPLGFRRYQTRMGPRAPSPVPQRRVRRARPSKRARTSGPGESSSSRPPSSPVTAAAETTHSPQLSPASRIRRPMFVLNRRKYFESLGEGAKTPVPSVEQPPKMEQKPLPSHLKYAYLGVASTLPVIISASLTELEEEKLLRVLRDHKNALGWSLADLKGIRPSMCIHRILLEEGYKPSVEAQRRLNSTMKEVVRKEVLKWLDTGVIYPISDSAWVSPVQVVPKKGGTTVIRTENNILLPSRTVTGCRICIDYRKLNKATRKDHFPLPFLDQMLDRLGGHEYYCFLDGYFGYNQISIAPEDQDKTTFTCPYGTFAFRLMPFGLCNAPGIFQRCMMAIFSDMVEKTIEIFMDDFSVLGNSFDNCLENLRSVLIRCEETNLVLY